MLNPNKRMESKWFNEVIAKMLGGKAEVTIERLTEKQVAAFTRFMVDDRSDYNGRRKIYESENGRYSATVTDRKHFTSMKVYDHWQDQVERIVRSIESLQEEIKEYGADEENITDLNSYQIQLMKAKQLINTPA